MNSTVFIIVSTVIIGLLLNLYIYNWVGWEKRTSQLLDLIAYTLAGTGLVASVFLIENFKNRIPYDEQRLAIINGSFDAGRLINNEIGSACGSPDQSGDTLSKFSDARLSECSALLKYALTILQLDHVHAPTFPVPPPLIYDPELRELRDNILAQVSAINKQNQRFQTDELKKALALSDFPQFIWLAFAASMLSLSFGIGLGRRSVDLYVIFKEAHFASPGSRRRRKKARMGRCGITGTSYQLQNSSSACFAALNLLYSAPTPPPP